MHLSTLVTGCTAALFLSTHERAALRRPPPTDTTENTASTGRPCGPVDGQHSPHDWTKQSRIISIMLHMMFRPARSRVPLSISVQSALRSGYGMGCALKTE